MITLYTVQLVLTKLCTKFQNPRSSSSREILDGKIVHTDRHTSLLQIWQKTIYPLYTCTSYTGGIISECHLNILNIGQGVRTGTSS